MFSNLNQTYHFVGIKGSGMSALATILHQKGFKVQGSDVETYFFTQRELEKKSIPIFPFDEKNITKNLVVIAGNAFPDTHPEIKEAISQGIEVIRYHDFLGHFIAQYKSVAVTGSHGKTTTTGMLSHVLSGIVPTSYLIGDGTGHGEKEAAYFAFEACEYRRHFLAYSPDYAIITNIDFDHPDYYRSIEDVFDAFQSFANQVKKAIIACGDDQHLKNLSVSVPIYYYGFDETNDFVAKNIRRTTQGSSFDVLFRGEVLGHFSIPTFGNHNILNAMSVIALSHLESLDLIQVSAELLTYAGVKRRFSEKQVDDMILVDDYAHHPVEIKATIDAARQKYVDKKIIAIFQPHTFTRTIALMDDFAAALDLADDVYLCDIFGSARENAADVSIQDLADKVTQKVAILDITDVSALVEYHDAVLLFMGAGDVQKFQIAYENLLSQLRKSKM